MKIAMWFDGGGPHGFGNIRRSRALGDALAGAGHEVCWMPLSARGAALAEMSIAAKEPTADIALLDIPYAGDRVLERARSTGTRAVVALDYAGTKSPDLVISLQDFRPLPVGCRCVCGPQFAIIRDEIRSAVYRGEKKSEVLVVVGGGDAEGLSARIAGCLPDVPIVIVQGPNGGPMDLNQPNLRVATNPPNLPEIMARCAWAVTTGGTTMLELLHLGKAVHVVPRTPAETAFAGRFWEKGGLLGIGFEALRPPSKQELEACERVGPGLVDGRGIERIVALMTAL